MTTPVGSVQGPLVSDADNPEGVANATYSNTEYPYGTGFYRWQHKQHGPYVFPELAKNWVDWGDLLQRLPGYGFLTNIDNSNYNSCVVQPSGQITDGLEMNDGFVKFIIENVFAPLPKNRRCGASWMRPWTKEMPFFTSPPPTTPKKPKPTSSAVRKSWRNIRRLCTSRTSLVPERDLSAPQPRDCLTGGVPLKWVA